MPECRLTPQEWNQYWKQLNSAVESQDEEWIYKAKAMVKEQIRLRKGCLFTDGEIILILFAPVSAGSPADLQFHSITSKVCFNSARAGSFKTADVLSVPLRVITAT